MENRFISTFASSRLREIQLIRFGNCLGVADGAIDGFLLAGRRRKRDRSGR